MKKSKKIRTPLRQHLRFFRQQQLPVLIWAVAVFVVAFLARRQAVRVDAIGIAEVHKVAVSSPVVGTVKHLAHDLFEPVKAGEIVATLDDSLVAAELNTVKTEITRLRAALAAEEARLTAEARNQEHDLRAEVRRFAWNAETAELDLLDRQVAQEVDQVEYQRLTVIFERLEKLVKENAARQSDLDEARLEREAVATRIQNNLRAIEAARKRRAATAARLKALPASPDVARIKTLLEPFRYAVEVQQARIKELTLRRQALILRASRDGVVSQVLLRPGEVAEAGTSVVILDDPSTTRVVAHIPEGSRRMDIQPGDIVELLRRTQPIQVMEAKVIRVGPSVEEIPYQQRRKPNIREWGRPVLIAAAELQLCPGETLDVRIPAVARPDSDSPPSRME